MVHHANIGNTTTWRRCLIQLITSACVSIARLYAAVGILTDKAVDAVAGLSSFAPQLCRLIH